MKELRWGILGCGVISNDFARSLKNCTHKNKIVAVAASKFEKAEEFLRDFGLDAKAYGNYAELLNNEDVDIVYIGLLNNMHLEWVLKSLDADKHVLCEKPMSINSDQIKQIIEKAHQKKKFVMEAFWSRFFPAWLKIREIIESKELGELKIFGANFCEELAKNRFELHNDESLIVDIGYYVIGLAIYAFNDEKPEKTEIISEKNSDGVDLWSSIVLRFKSGRHATLYYNGTMRASTNAFLGFENGLIEIPSFFWCPEEMIKNTGVVPDVKQEKLEFKLEDYDGYNINHCAGLHYEADHVFEQIEQGNTESSIMSLGKTQQIVQVIEELRKQIGVIYKSDSK